MQNQNLYLLELTKEDIEDIISALDSVVKTNGLSVAERCAQLHRLLLSSKPKPVAPPAPPVQPEPARFIPNEQEQAIIESKAKEKLNKELEELIEEKPKKSKSSTKKKTAKKK